MTGKIDHIDISKEYKGYVIATQFLKATADETDRELVDRAVSAMDDACKPVPKSKKPAPTPPKNK